MLREPRARRVAAALLLLLLLLATFDVKAVLAQAAGVAAAQYASRPSEVLLATTVSYAVWIVAFIPTTLPELVMGFTFGLRVGYAVDLVGKLAGSLVCYVLGRSFLRQWLRSLLLEGTFKEIFLAFEEEVISRPWRTAAMLRIAWVPISAKNYGMAIIGVPPLHFMGTLLPLEVVDTYVPVAIGSTAKDIASLLRGKYDAEKSRAAALQLGLVGMEGTLLIVLLAHMGRVANAAIERQRQRRKRTAVADAEEQPG